MCYILMLISRKKPDYMILHPRPNTADIALHFEEYFESFPESAKFIFIYI